MMTTPIRETLSAIQADLRDAGFALRSSTRQAGSATMDQVRAQPAAALGVAVLAGALLALFLRGR